MSIKELLPKGLDPKTLSVGDRALLGLLQDESLPIPEIISKPYLEKPEAIVEFTRFHADQLRRLHLEALNGPLVENNLYPLFTPYEMFGLEVQNSFLERTKKVDMVGDKVALALISVIFGYEKDGKTPKYGQFGPLIMKESAFRQEGSLYFVLTNGQPEIPTGDIQGEVVMSEEMLREINEGLRKRERAILPEGLAGRGNQGPNSVRSVDFNDGNERFYTVISLNLNDGRRLPLLFNRLGDDGSHGEVSVVRFTDGDFGLVVNPRPLIGGSVIELPRGFSAKGEEKYAELRQETGLKIEWGELVEKSRLMQDTATDFVFPDLSVVRFDKMHEMGMDEESQRLTDEGLESLVHGRMSSQEVIASIERGEIVDTYTITGITALMIRTGELVYSSHYKTGLNLVMEERFLPQLARTGLVIPRGPIDRGTKIAEIPPDTGKARIFYQLRSGNPAILVPDSGPTPKYVKVPVMDVVNKLANHDFDIVTAAGVAKGLIDKRILIHKSSV
jgi:hypothetical protein